jgi:hypothetical protein
MRRYRITIEHALYLLAFLLALGLRLYGLGAAPLSDPEASWALQALEVAGGRAPLVIGPQPGYVLLTGLFFWLAGASSFAARLLPALSGALLVWLPYLLRSQSPATHAGAEREPVGTVGAVGRLAALIAAFGLAFDPGLVALSRQAGSVMPAVSLGLLALFLAWSRRPVLAGVCGGLALLMGPAALYGAVVFVLAWAAGKLMERLQMLAPMEAASSGAAALSAAASSDAALSAPFTAAPVSTAASEKIGGAAFYPSPEEELGGANHLWENTGAGDPIQGSLSELDWEPAEEIVTASPAGGGRPGRSFWTRLLVSAGLTILLAGTVLLRYPAGLSAWASSLVAYLQGWVPSGQVETASVPALRLLAALPFYSPLALLFGLLGLAAVWIRPAWFWPGSGLLQRLSLWLLAALLLALVYPARGMGDLAWALVPLWFLAGAQIARLLQPETVAASASPVLWLSQALLIFILFALFWLNLAGLTGTPSGTQAYTLRLGVMFGVIALAVLTTALVGLGWSWDAAVRGLVWGLGISLGAATLSAAWGAAHLTPARILSNQNIRQELWSPGPEVAHADLLVETVKELAEWDEGWSTEVQIALAVDSPALAWAFREFPDVNRVGSAQASLPASAGAPGVVITGEEAAAPSLTAAYRGQDFAWRILPTWTGALPDDLFRWWAFRQAPARIERVILWARSDLFPGGEDLMVEP